MSSDVTQLPTPSFAEFLESYPLYKRVLVPIGSHEGRPVFFFPKKITMYCDAPQCGRNMEWQTWSYNNESAEGVREPTNYGNIARAYTCKHCEANTVEFFLYRHIARNQMLEMEKVGQRPRPLPILSHELSAGLGEQGKALYLKAVESRNQDMGIGALSYLRRVVEDAMNALLDLIRSAVVGSDNEEALIQEIDKAKQEKVFTKKVGLAKAILPSRFFHAGHNPLERLHDWASAGLHNRDDWECIEIFDEIRALFELLFERLAREADDRKLYESKLIQLTRKK